MSIEESTPPPLTKESPLTDIATSPPPFLLPDEEDEDEDIDHEQHDEAEVNTTQTEPSADVDVDDADGKKVEDNIDINSNSSSELSDLGEDNSEAETDKMDFLEDEGNSSFEEARLDLQALSKLTALTESEFAEDEDLEVTDDKKRLLEDSDDEESKKRIKSESAPELANEVHTIAVSSTDKSKQDKNGVKLEEPQSQQAEDTTQSLVPRSTEEVLEAVAENDAAINNAGEKLKPDVFEKESTQPASKSSIELEISGKNTVETDETEVETEAIEDKSQQEGDTVVAKKESAVEESGGDEMEVDIENNQEEEKQEEEGAITGVIEPEAEADLHEEPEDAETKETENEDVENEDSELKVEAKKDDQEVAETEAEEGREGEAEEGDEEEGEEEGEDEDEDEETEKKADEDSKFPSNEVDDVDLNEQRKLAIEELVSIETDFADLRDRLYKDKLQLLEHELQLCLEGSHPELSKIYYKINGFHQDSLKYANANLKYKLKCIDRQTIATRTSIHQDYLKNMMDFKNDMIANTTSLWYKINKERNQMDQIVPDYNFAGIPTHNIQYHTICNDNEIEIPSNKKALKQQALIELVQRRNNFNKEIGIQAGLLEFQGFPSAVSTRLSELNIDESAGPGSEVIEELLLRKATEEEIEDDLKAMGIPI